MGNFGKFLIVLLDLIILIGLCVVNVMVLIPLFKDSEIYLDIMLFCFVSIFIVFFFLTMFTEPGYIPHKNILKNKTALNYEGDNLKVLEVLSLDMKNHIDKEIRTKMA